MCPEGCAPRVTVCAARVVMCSVSSVVPKRRCADYGSPHWDLLDPARWEGWQRTRSPEGMRGGSLCFPTEFCQSMSPDWSLPGPDWAADVELYSPLIRMRGGVALEPARQRCGVISVGRTAVAACGKPAGGGCYRWRCRTRWPRP